MNDKKRNHEIKRTPSRKNQPVAQQPTNKSPINLPSTDQSEENQSTSTDNPIHQQFDPVHQLDPDLLDDTALLTVPNMPHLPDALQVPTQEEIGYIFDSESSMEMVRLINLGQLVTQTMDGLLEGLPLLSQMNRILDVACGPGEWALKMAYTYPNVEVVGIDLSNFMINFAWAQAMARGLPNVKFQLMDARKPLVFADEWFDIVNGRFLSGFLSKVDWPKLVKELVRITRPCGIIRLTESDDSGLTNSPALEQYQYLLLRATYLAGMSFYPNPETRSNGLIPMLGEFLQDAGCQNIQLRSHILDYSAGSKAHASICENWQMIGKLAQPFLLKMRITTQEELDNLYEQMLKEMMMPNFRALWHIVSVWGEKPQPRTQRS